MTLEDLMNSIQRPLLDLTPADLSRLDSDERARAGTLALVEKSNALGAIGFCRRHAMRYGEDMTATQAAQNEALIAQHQAQSDKAQRIIDAVAGLAVRS